MQGKSVGERVSVVVPPAVAAELRTRAARYGLSLSALARTILVDVVRGGDGSGSVSP